jgi:eukaryotic-like serine/threonine-protein kinase
MQQFDEWNVQRELQGGGQGDAFIVVHDGDQERYFLKLLKAQGNSERRARFFRETSFYRTLRHKGIPQLVATNADRFQDKNASLYLVTEFVDGLTLAEAVRQSGPLSSEAAFAVTEGLANVLVHAHDEEAVHRDIKPENILLRNGRPEDPVLVDWGLGFRALEGDDHRTDTGQELGNRFLRLPEFAAGSRVKRDGRSDVIRFPAD